VTQAEPTFWNTTPPIVLWLMGAIAAAYGLYAFAPIEAKAFALYAFSVIPARFAADGPAPYGSPLAALAALMGHMFLHGGILHLGMNLMVMAQGAPFVARRLGDVRFLVLFFGAGLAGALAYIGLNPAEMHQASLASAHKMVGASGAICGVFGAYFLAVRPSPRMALQDPGVRSAIGSFLLFNVVLAGLAEAAGILPIAWQAHLGGFLGGAGLYVALAPRSRGPWSASRR